MTSNTPPSSCPQKILINLVESEIGGQIWEFEAQDIARILSPKCLKNPGVTPIYPSLDDFSYLIEDPSVSAIFDQLSVPDAPDPVTTETGNYDALCLFFNDCTLNCKKGYAEMQAQGKLLSFFPLSPKGQHLWPELVFYKPTVDGIDNAAPLKSDLVVTFSCAWASTRVSEVLPSYSPIGIDISGEAKNLWSLLIKQSATYARVQRSAIPFRLFSVAIAVNHIQKNIRFLLYHCGGLSASRLLDLTSFRDRSDIQKILFSVYLWQTAENAGLPSFTDGVDFKLPNPIDPTKEVAMRVREVYHHALSVRGRNTWVAALELLQLSSVPVPSLIPKRRSTYLVARPLQRPRNCQPRKSRLVHSEPSQLFHGMSTPKAVTPESAQSKTSEKDQVNPVPIYPQRFHNLGTHFTSPSTFLRPKEPREMPENVVVKFVWTTMVKRELEANVYVKCHGEFGIPAHVMSFEVKTEGGWTFSNSYLFPRPGEEDTSFQPLLGSKWEREAPDFRSLWITIFEDEGVSLDHCTSAWDLCECLVHGMLGWLSYYQNGYMHRDVSIGNVLKLKTTVKRKPFSTKSVQSLLESPATESDQSKAAGSTPSNPKVASDVFSDSAEALHENMAQLDIEGDASVAPDSFWHNLLNKFNNDVQRRPTVKYAKRLEEIVGELDIETDCVAVLSDCDMVAEMTGYFALNNHQGSISGTPEFMSSNLRNAIDDRETYMQSPVDDMHSFFWTATWAILFNINYQGTTKEAKWKNNLQSEYVNDRDAVASQILSVETQHNPDYAQILRTMVPVLKSWRNKLALMNEEWILLSKVQGLHNSDPVSKMLLFHRFAYRGVLDFLEVIKDNHENLRSAQSS